MHNPIHDSIIMGPIIWGTHKTEELMYAIANEIDRLSPTYPSILHEAREYLEGDHPAYGLDGAAESILEDMIGWLNAQCPPGLYFGTPDGDEAVFGFWEIEDHQCV